MLSSLNLIFTVLCNIHFWSKYYHLYPIVSLQQLCPFCYDHAEGNRCMGGCEGQRESRRGHEDLEGNEGQGQTSASRYWACSVLLKSDWPDWSLLRAQERKQAGGCQC
jgi:hypothetical protein